MDTMKDTKLDLHPDPMCIPIVDHTHDPFRLRGETFVQSYITYINFMYDHPEHMDPMDPMVVY